MTEVKTFVFIKLKDRPLITKEISGGRTEAGQLADARDMATTILRTGYEERVTPKGSTHTKLVYTPPRQVEWVDVEQGTAEQVQPKGDAKKWKSFSEGLRWRRLVNHLDAQDRKEYEKRR